MSGQFLIEYEVAAESRDNDILVLDNYFIHYFTPKNLPLLPKHVIFVLDISGSMVGRKLHQMKDSIFTIIDELTDRDFFSIITFESKIFVWNPSRGKSIYYVIKATEKNKEEAIKFLINISADGGTNINDGLLKGLQIAKFAIKNNIFPKDVKSILIFLTDGQPSYNKLVRNRRQIIDNVIGANVFKIPIYGLAFGKDADIKLISLIASNSGTVSKRIYQGRDAFFQLEDFFIEISKPILVNVTFKYYGSKIDNSSISQSEVQLIFRGGEFIVVGKLQDLQPCSLDTLTATVSANGGNETQYLRRIDVCLKSCNGSLENCTSSSPLTQNLPEHFAKRLHAFLNTKQLLSKSKQDIENRKAYEEKALQFALDNNFVTDLTSFVVVCLAEEPKLVVSLSKPFKVCKERCKGVSKKKSKHRKLTKNRNKNKRRKLNKYMRKMWNNRTSKKSKKHKNRQINTSKKSKKEKYSLKKGISNEDKKQQSTNKMTERSKSTRLKKICRPKKKIKNQTKCSGHIILFSDIYLRGENATFRESTEDLQDFNNLLVSVLVEGNCCWTIFNKEGFKGISQCFSKGNYKSLVQVKDVFRDGSSLIKSDCL